MKKLFLVLALPLVLLSCQIETGSGNLVKENRNVGNFTGIDVAGSFDVEVLQGSSSAVVVEADDNLINDVETELDGSTLKIRLRNHKSLRNPTLRVFVTAPNIDEIIASASANVESKCIIKNEDEIKTHASSASEIKLNVDAPTIELEASSGSQLNITGRTRNLVANASSGSDVKAKNLLSETTTAQASSGASLYVYASNKLNAQASSGGSVHYTGKPTTVSKQESSGGSVSN